MGENIIPKVIHYCWFGKKNKPNIVKSCISSWKKYLSDYEIIEWNEYNFDINSNIFVKQAYNAGLFAFVSDYVRVFALYNYGGIYMDTDVEVLKPFDESILNNDSFWGFEEKNYIATSTIGAKQENKLIKRFLDTYKEKKFLLENGKFDTLTNVVVVSKIIKKLGVRLDGTYQELEDIGTFYEQDYFSPYDYINCYMKKTNNTYVVHHFYKSWLPFSTRLKGGIKKMLAKTIGGDRIAKFRKSF